MHSNNQSGTTRALYTISTMHCMTVSLAYEGEGLGTVWGRQKAEKMLVAAGFSPERCETDFRGSI